MIILLWIMLGIYLQGLTVMITLVCVARIKDERRKYFQPMWKDVILCLLWPIPVLSLLIFGEE